MSENPNQPPLPGIWISPAAEIWTPNRDGAVVDENPIRLDDTNQVVVRFWRNGRSIQDFTIHQQLRFLGQWHDVVRVDCSHAEVHYHLMDRENNELKREVFRKIEGIGDVTKGYGVAHEWLWSTYQENTRRWQSGK